MCLPTTHSSGVVGTRDCMIDTISRSRVQGFAKLCSQLSQPATRADVCSQPLVTLLLILPQLGAFKEVDTVQVFVAAFFVVLQLRLHLRRARRELPRAQAPTAQGSSPSWA